MSSIRSEENAKQLSEAAESLSPEYNSNEELTAFTSLDFEDFNEAR